jgi:hypothetical protein
MTDSPIRNKCVAKETSKEFKPGYTNTKRWSPWSQNLIWYRLILLDSPNASCHSSSAYILRKFVHLRSKPEGPSLQQNCVKHICILQDGIEFRVLLSSNARK